MPRATKKHLMQFVVVETEDGCGCEGVPEPPPADAELREDSSQSAGETEPVELKLDLHEIYNRGSDIDRALTDIVAQAVAKKAPFGGDHP